MFELSNKALKELNELLRQSTANLGGLNIWFTNSTVYIHSEDAQLTYGISLRKGDINPFFMIIYLEVKKYLQDNQ